MSQTLAALIADHDADTKAIGAQGRPWATYGDLRDQTARVARELHDIGVGRGDRVAVVLANGPEMAAAYFSIAQVATVAPLNPAYQKAEYEFYVQDLGAKALLVAEDYDGPALVAAQNLGVAVLRLSARPRLAAGIFSILANDTLGTCDRSAPGERDVALILHTSGTTSRPKIVPLTQANVYASAHNIRTSLALTGQDRCLNVMPLFHIHGLIAAVSASMAAGAQIWCAPNFNALQFFSQMADVRPTWYTAVPTMHQAILARAERNKDVVADTQLRFLRSSSASLPAPVMRALEQTFQAPVIEAYGMTEATHQMCSNPLSKGGQKPGSVGVPAGPIVRIAAEERDELIDVIQTGEVVISGPNVTPGYENNATANAANFFDVEGERWFRTGDQGAFDADGYLHLTGRLKEIINRGGEKISPLEVDAALLEHPDISQAVCFAVPHDKLGEEIAAAVVLNENAALDETGIRAFAAERLAKFKVPRRIEILTELPKGATGKIQRIGMAEKLGLVGADA